jgi:hypothetical protein
MCHRTFSLEDLRTGRAEIREARVLCPRCIARVDRTKRRVDLRFVGALVFILVIFPAGAAFLIHLALSKDLEGGNGAEGTEAPGTQAPGPGARTEFPPSPNPGAPTAAEPPAPPPSPEPPAETAPKTIPPEDIRQILKNLQEERGGSAPAPVPPLLRDPFPGSREPGGPPGAGALPQLLSSPDPAIRLEGVLRIASTEGGTDLLLRALEDKDPYVRSTAAAVLGRRKDPAGVGPLLGLIRDPVFMVRKAASHALVDAANLKFRAMEDLSKKELEFYRRYIEDVLKKK